MKIALIVSGAAALILIIIGCALYIPAMKRKDAGAMAKAIPLLVIGTLCLAVFSILLRVAAIKLVSRLF